MEQSCKWLTDDEALTYLRMDSKQSKRVLWHWCRKGRIKYAKCGKSYRFLSEWLDAFLMVNGAPEVRRRGHGQAA